MAKKKESAGGKAEAAGGNYETLVAAWYCTRLLLGRAADPVCDLPSTTRLVALTCQSKEPVDDVNCETADKGMIFVQAKRTVSLSEGDNTPLGKALDQFVLQQKVWSDGVGTLPGARPFDANRDRLVLATRSSSSQKIVETLPKLLRGLRDRSDRSLLSEVQTSQEDHQVAEVVENHVKRSWRRAYGKEPSPAEIGFLLRLVWVQKLDVEDGGPDRSMALSLMRSTLLEQPPQADAAFAELIRLCARLRAERSSSDIPTLQAILVRIGIRLKALPDYLADIEALREWTNLQLRKAPRFMRLLEGTPGSIVEREIWPTFYDNALKQSFLVIGDPGAGKSGLIYRMGAQLLDSHADVVFIPADVLNVESLSGLQAELGIGRSLAEILQNWPGPGRGVLIVDALDAARKLETQTVLRESIDQVLRSAGGRWNVVASVRKYDLRQGSDWRHAFRGSPLDGAFADREFHGARHLSVGRLTDQEIAQTTKFSSELQHLFSEANLQLKTLLRNIFNLHLLAELFSQGVITSELIAIHTQSELLETYWRHRIRRDDGKHDAREIALSTVIQEMIARKSLRVFRADIRGKADGEALADLERHDILRADEDARGADEDILLFSHHVLFDYCVARLLFRRGKDPARLVELLRNDRTLALMVAPSLSMSLHDAWDSDATRAAFWDVALAIATRDQLPEVAYLAAPMVAAESASTLDDLQPLLQRLTGNDPDLRAAERNMTHLIGALLVRYKGGTPLVGTTAGPWMEFAEALASVGTDAASFATKPLVAVGTEDPALLTARQLTAAGAAARRMLEFGLGWARRPGSLIVAGIIGVAKTIGSDVAASSGLLRRLIEPQHLPEFGHEELRWLARNTSLLAKHDAPFVVDLYKAAYGHEDSQSDAKTMIGNSGILPLTSNRRQDYQYAWYQLKEAAPALLKEFPFEGTQAIARAMFGYVQRAQRPSSGVDLPVQSFALGGITTRYVADRSHAWYRGGVRVPQDGPALLQKFDTYLSDLTSQPDAAARLQRILEALAGEAGLAVMWASLLVAGAEHPSEFGQLLAPLAAAAPMLSGWDTRHQAGRFITAAYPVLDSASKNDIEQTILALSDERSKKILAGCIPEGLSVTPEMRELKEALRSDPEAPINRPLFQITTTQHLYDTDAYLKEQGVSTADPISAKLREATRDVENLPKNIQGKQLTLEVARQRVETIRRLRDALEATPEQSVDRILYETAEGTLAEAAAHTSLAPVEVLKHADIRRELMTALLLTANSEYPHFDAAHEETFHENLSWPSPSARASAARGLICLIRGDANADTEALIVIRKLARDPVCHVRLHIAGDLQLLHAIDPVWMWSELEYVVMTEPTRGVVDAALQAAAQIRWLDVPRFIALCQSVLSRYAGQSAAGMESCHAAASSLIADAYIWTDNEQAREFVAQELKSFPSNSQLMGQWIFRYAGNLMVGSSTSPTDRNNAARIKTIGLYRDILNRSLAEADRLCKERNIHEFESWPEAEQESLREMYHVMDELALRLHFAAGADTPQVDVTITTERARFYREARPLLENLSDVMAVHVAHYVIQTLEALIPIDPTGVFDLIARSVKASEQGGYTMESMAADLIVRIVERYLADHRDVFADQARLNALMDCLDAFGRAGWPAAQALMFRLSEIWR